MHEVIGMPVIKRCLNCDSEMKVKPSQIERKKYCSKKCKGEYQRKFPTSFTHLKNGKNVECNNCGKLFYRKNSSISEKNFCNRGCRNEFLRKNAQSNNQHLKKRLFFKCKECDGTFEVIESRKESAKFCSIECLGKSNGRRAAIQLRNRIEVNCTNCDTPIEKKPSVITNWNFCNVQCMAEFYEESGAFTGEKNGAWLGGKMTYYGPNWLSQRRRARERDNYCCQECGITEKEYGRELSVHHKKRFKLFFGDWFQANQIDNLESLCEPCHKSRHQKDYKEFMKIYKERLKI